MAEIISTSLDTADPVTKPVVQTHPASGAVEYVGNMTLTCHVEGGTRLVYQWRKNGKPVHISSTYSLSPQNNTLQIVPVTKEDIGSYSCLVKNPVSEVESDVVVPTIYCKQFGFPLMSTFSWEGLTGVGIENICTRYALDITRIVACY